MNSKTAFAFVVAFAATAAFSPAISQESPKSTAGAQFTGPRLPVDSMLKKTPHSGISKTNYGAGYFAYPSTGNVGSVSATFRVPAIHCQSASDQEWLLPGIWVYDSSGNLTQQVDVNLNCNNGAMLLEAVICINGGSCDTSLAITPGDLIVATLSETPSGSFGQIRDITSGQTKSVSGTAAPTNDYTVFVGIEGPSLFVRRRRDESSDVPESNLHEGSSQRLLPVGLDTRSVQSGDDRWCCSGQHHSAAGQWRPVREQLRSQLNGDLCHVATGSALTGGAGHSAGRQAVLRMHRCQFSFHAISFCASAGFVCDGAVAERLKAAVC